MKTTDSDDWTPLELVARNLSTPRFQRIVRGAEKTLNSMYDENARLRTALSLIASPQRSDGTLDREACRQIAQDALEGK